MKIILILLIFLFKGDCMEKPILVNKHYALHEDYIPNDLKIMDKKYTKGERLLRKEAKEHIEKLIEDASHLKYQIKVTSAYRSFAYQQNLFDYYVKNKGLTYASLCSAMPGHSEHQTGLAIDVEGSNEDYNQFEKSKEFSWMSQNAHHYGFILRYPKGKEEITGFKYEPWHYRYVGKSLATYLYKNNLTLEEYIK